MLYFLEYPLSIIFEAVIIVTSFFNIYMVIEEVNVHRENKLLTNK